jgi:hypothetical protein
MEGMKKAFAILLLLLAAAAGIAAEGAKVSFTWTFVKRATDGSALPVDFGSRVNIKPGDLFKIHIQPGTGSYVYLVLQDSAGEVQRLFPEEFDLFDKPSYPTTRFFMPEGDDWFTLDGNRGTERFFLLASSERLRSLESLLLALDKTTSNQNSTVAAKNSARQAVLDEIKRLAKEHSQLSAAAEKPVTIAGGTRGINEAVAKVATRIEASGFYTKTFRLEH